MTQALEIWRDIPGYDDRYQASNLGNVFDKRSTRRSGLIKQLPNCRTGYMQVQLRDGARQANRKVHQLVLEAFVGPREAGQICRHLNGVRNDNRLENLAWGTKQENMRDWAIHECERMGLLATTR